jgi:hypothetical protein
MYIYDQLSMSIFDVNPLALGTDSALPSHHDPPTPQPQDAVLDLKTLELPLRLVVSGGRDGEIKLWK